MPDSNLTCPRCASTPGHRDLTCPACTDHLGRERDVPFSAAEVEALYDTPSTWPSVAVTADVGTRANLASDRDWAEDFSHENGNYLCRCQRCTKMFYGHKRRIVCHECAEKAMLAEDPKDEPMVRFATVRDGGDEWHVECRMSDGQKGAFVTVDSQFPGLAHQIAAALTDAGSIDDSTKDEADQEAGARRRAEDLEAREVFLSAFGLPDDDAVIVAAKALIEVIVNWYPSDPETGYKTAQVVVKQYAQNPASCVHTHVDPAYRAFGQAVLNYRDPGRPGMARIVHHLAREHDLADNPPPPHPLAQAVLSPEAVFVLEQAVRSSAQGGFGGYSSVLYALETADPFHPARPLLQTILCTFGFDVLAGDVLKHAQRTPF